MNFREEYPYFSSACKKQKSEISRNSSLIIFDYLLNFSMIVLTNNIHFLPGNVVSNIPLKKCS